MRHFIYILVHATKDNFFLSSYWTNSCQYDVADINIHVTLKFAVIELNYLEFKGIPIGRIDTHPPRGGGTNALSLAGYSDREIQKMGQWKSDIFKE